MVKNYHYLIFFGKTDYLIILFEKKTGEKLKKKIKKVFKKSNKLQKTYYLCKIIECNNIDNKQMVII